MAHELALPVWTVLPFTGLLLAVAILPLAAPHFWESHRNKGLVALLFSLPVVLYLVLASGAAGVHELAEKAREYTSFILLLGALFIDHRRHLRARLALGNAAAQHRPARDRRRARERYRHHRGVGAADPAAAARERPARAQDPHRGLLHLHRLELRRSAHAARRSAALPRLPEGRALRLDVPALEGVAARERHAARDLQRMGSGRVRARGGASGPARSSKRCSAHEPLRIEGRRNFLFLAAGVAAIVASGHGLGNGGAAWPFGVQELLLLGLAVVAYATTPHAYRMANAFAFGPILEVAVLFAGIFVTMAPALLLLNANAEHFGLSQPWQFFWAAGALSSFLDNAPTYLTFAATACGLEGIPLEGRYLAELLARGPEAERILVAISCGAVMMGANTYIGNGPNFMVKAIAEADGVPMPSFFAYMAYSGGVLLPIFAVVTWLFFR